MASLLARKIATAQKGAGLITGDNVNQAINVIDVLLPESARVAPWTVNKTKGVWLWGDAEEIPRGVDLNADIGFALILGGVHWARVEQYVMDAASMGARVLRLGFEVSDRKNNIGYDWAWLVKYGAKLPMWNLHAGDGPMDHYIATWEPFKAAMERLLELCRKYNLYLWVVLGDGGPRSALNQIGIGGTKFSSGDWLRQWRVRDYLKFVWENMVAPYASEPHIFAWELWNEPDAYHWFFAVEGKPTRREEYNLAPALFFSEWCAATFESMRVRQPKTLGLWTFDAAGELIVEGDTRQAFEPIAAHPTFREAWDFQDAHYYERGGVTNILDNWRWLNERWNDNGFKWPFIAGELSFDWDRPEMPTSSEDVSAWMVEKANLLRANLAHLPMLLWGIHYNNPEHWDKDQWTYHWNLKSTNGGAAAQIIREWWSER